VSNDTFTVDVVAETLARTSLGRATVVNLERAATPATRLGGHLVQGHVDGVGTLLDRGEDAVVRIGIPLSWPDTWSRRARSRSTGSASRWWRRRPTRSPSR
jgi:riboflavin synthase alpha subunit